MLSEKKLTLDTAIDMLRSNEITRRQLSRLSAVTDPQQGTSNEDSVHYASRGERQNRNPRSTRVQLTSCMRCGQQHGKSTCPAFGKTCNACGKRNHFAAVCRQAKPQAQPRDATVRYRPVRNIAEDTAMVSIDDESDAYYFEEIRSMSNLQKQSSRWVVPLTLRPADDENTRFLPDCGYETVECQLDSGSTCEVMTLRQCCQILQNGDPKMDESHCCLRFYDGSTIKPVGVCHFICQKNDCEAKLSFQIIDTEEERQIPPLL